jgi:hypothetical protein
MMIPSVRVLLGAEPAAPSEVGAFAVVAEPPVVGVLFAVFDEELQAAAPTSNNAAPTALSALFALNRLIS